MTNSSPLNVSAEEEADIVQRGRSVKSLSESAEICQRACKISKKRKQEHLLIKGFNRVQLYKFSVSHYLIL
jgi:hypothetical protein